MMTTKEVPWDNDAERCVLGAGITNPSVLSDVMTVISPGDFFSPENREVAAALWDMSNRKEVIDEITVAAELDKRRNLDAAPKPLVLDLIHAVGGTSAAADHAGIVRKHADARSLLRISGELSKAASNGSDPKTISRLHNEFTGIVASSAIGTADTERSVDGASFVFDTPETPIAIWGRDGEVLWASGESLMIVGPSGVGKTTLAQQLVLARLGIRDQVLGFPILPEPQRVLYIAADRPGQAARSLARMVSEDDKSTLKEGLVVWRGPLPFDLGQNPERFVSFVEAHGATSVVIDSAKDAAFKLSDDEVGARFNHAVQCALAAGIEVIVLHHQRKRQQGGGKPTKLEDVFGSVWITAGAGSVLLLWGESGDLLVDLSHLKQPAENVGPLKLLHDHNVGLTEVIDSFDPLKYVRARATGVTAQEIAVAMSDKSVPDRNDVERARRKLDGLVRRKLLHRQEGTRGGRGESRNPARYFSINRQENPR